MIIPLLLAGLLLDTAVVDRQQLTVAIDPVTHRVEGSSRLRIAEGGDLAYRMHPRCRVEEVLVDGVAQPASRNGFLEDLAGGATVTMRWQGTHLEDVEAGEIEGEIHNRSVRAHVGTDGVFLSSGSAWHPQPLDERGVPQLREMSIEIEPLPGWSLVACGNPTSSGEPTAPVWGWGRGS